MSTAPAPAPQNVKERDAARDAGDNPVRRTLKALAAGELGSLRVLIVLAIIWVIFQIANDRFLTSINLTNLTLQIAAVGCISVGVTLVLLLGEIDLSVGAVSGLSAAVMGVLAQQGISVPADISVIGWDDSEAAALSLVGLTSVVQRPAELARLAVQRIVDRVTRQPVVEREIVLAPELHVRESTGRPRP